MCGIVEVIFRHTQAPKTLGQGEGHASFERAEANDPAMGEPVP